jgi:broad specificity phosphatase PhoE
MTTTLILVRHGQTTWNCEGRFRGRANIPLDDTGLAQAQAASQYIAVHWKPKAVYCSPLLRARQTAEAIAEPFILHERAHPGFLDLDVGAWEGLTEDEVNARWTQALRAWHETPENAPIPGGESLEVAQRRAMGAIREVVNRYPDDAVVVVAHTAINRLILLGLFDMDLAHFWHLGQGVCAINVLEFDESSFKLLQMNYTEHLVTFDV